MFGRGLLGTIITGGIVVALSYFLMPKQRARLMMSRKRWPLSRRNMMNLGKFLARTVNR